MLKLGFDMFSFGILVFEGEINIAIFGLIFEKVIFIEILFVIVFYGDLK